MSDDLFREIHEELADQYMENHPGIDWSTAYDLTADAAYNEYVERYAAMIDYQRMANA